MCSFFLLTTLFVVSQAQDVRLGQATTALPTRDEDICALPSEIGDCDGVFPSWFYNSATGACELFDYGGCGGNANRFETEAECQTACDICALGVYPGPCKAAFPRYYWNTDTNTCDSFIYGGCEGNANNFETNDACLQSCCDGPDACVALYSPVCCDGVQYSNGCSAESVCAPNCVEGECPTATEADICVLGVYPGPCKGSFPRFYWNTDTNTCDSFIYGGCEGNENNFETNADCLKSCCDGPDVCADVFDPYCCDGVQYGNECEAQSVCAVKCVQGECATIGTGCDGPDACDAVWDPYCCDGVQYGNECEAQSVCAENCQQGECPDICALPQEVGPCDAAIDRFYWNSVSGTCESFTYGGCDGNGNNFESKEDCLTSCCDGPEICTREYDPVCCDGVTYGNDCEARSVCAVNCESGECCDGPQVCTEQYDPVCCDGVTYGNSCEAERVCALNCESGECPTETDICALPQEVGPCEALINRFYWNSETGTCESFIYGGCEGNENNFESKEDCLESCCDGPELCTLQYDPVCCDGVTYGNECGALSVCAINCQEGECPTEPGTTEGSCDDDDDCEDGYSCKYRRGCVPPSWTAETTAVGDCDGDGLRDGVCIRDDSYCSGRATVDAFTGLTSFSKRGGVCKWCLCQEEGERDCYRLDGDDIDRLAALDDTFVEDLFNVICNKDIYPDLENADGDQCPWLEIRLKDAALIDECWCSALVCASNPDYGSIGNRNGVKQYGIMTGIIFIIGICSWL